ncbi:MAG: winged helix-turn-helix transcriptional regulator [Thermoplasmata archaeon]|nr:MAG: winged helix-turn-helix transcriptional regulator [Thermoplasmata archaeon]
MKILRDLRLSTELLILLEVIKNPHIKLKTIAEKLDITVQGASEYLRRMKKNGFIQDIGREYRATKKGIEFLHTNFSELKEFVDLKISELNIIDVCAAIAKTPIKKGDEVGLYMENGILVAYADKKSQSKGTALSNAEIGEDVAIKDLDGMVALSPGKMHIVKLPSIREGGSSSVSTEWVKKLHRERNPHKLGVVGMVSQAVVRKANLVPDFEFAPLLCAVEAVERGLSVMLFASSDQIHNVVSTIENINSTIEDKIDYEILEQKE